MPPSNEPKYFRDFSNFSKEHFLEEISHIDFMGLITEDVNKSMNNIVERLQLIAELGGRRPPSGAPYPYKGTKGNPWIDFLMCIMASGIARGHVRTTTTTTTVESRNMAAMLQLMG